MHFNNTIEQTNCDNNDNICTNPSTSSDSGVHSGIDNASNINLSIKSGIAKLTIKNEKNDNNNVIKNLSNENKLCDNDTIKTNLTNNINDNKLLLIDEHLSINEQITNKKENSNKNENIINDVNYSNLNSITSNNENDERINENPNTSSVSALASVITSEMPSSSSLSAPPSSSLSSTSNRSNRISIVSLDDDDIIDSSVIDSDEEYDNDDPFSIPTRNNSDYIIKKLGEHHNVNSSHLKNDDLIVINQKFDGMQSAICATSHNNNNIDNNSNSDSNSVGILGNDVITSAATIAAANVKPNIGSIAVQNSTDITFGNKTFYQGPVTIKQFLLEKKRDDVTEAAKSNNPNNTTPTTVNGKDNLGFDSDDNIEANQRNSNNRFNLNNTQGYLSRRFNLNTKAAAISGATVLLLLILGVIVFIVQFLLKSGHINPGDGDDSRKNIPINSTIDGDNISDGSILRIVTRDEWIAQPPMNPLTPLEIPTYRVIIAHTATEGCNTQAACTFRVRYIQTFHIESRNFDDIAYNFLVGGDGAVYEGRGWDKQGAHTKGYNVGSICIAFIGTFITVEPPEKQLKAAKLIIEQGVRLGKLKPDYKLYGHRQLIPSESPGEALYKIIQKWSHWTNEL